MAISLSNGPFQCLTLTLLILPPILLTTYFFAAFPSPPEPLLIYPSLESLPKAHSSWDIYPEEFYDGGAYVKFPYGKVRYWLIGPEDGEKIVLIHGLSIPAMIWKDVAPQLAEKGYRVLLYDLYGRGYSEAPATTYTTALYTTQLALLMQHIKWDKAHIIDDRVALIACAGLMESNDLPRTAKFMSSPLVQTIAGSSIVRSYLQHLIVSKGNSTPKASSDVSPRSDEKQHPLGAGKSDGEAEATDPVKMFAKKPNNGVIVRIQSAHLPGYNGAVASSLRDGPIRGLHCAFSDGDAWRGKHIVLIHGTQDNTVPVRYADKIKGLIEGAVEKFPASEQTKLKLVKVLGGKHDLTMSHPDLVIEEIVQLFT
ncbi:hypothetical protein ONZ45_g5096 [Pleurotus djamor]|nr:hypothetical protein ONZ45_g5096 [Pleurotus djamor]